MKGVEVPSAVYKVLRADVECFTLVCQLFLLIPNTRLPTRIVSLICFNFIRQSLRLSLCADLILVRNSLHESGMVGRDVLADSHDKRPPD